MNWISSVSSPENSMDSKPFFTAASSNLKSKVTSKASPKIKPQPKLTVFTSNASLHTTKSLLKISPHKTAFPQANFVLKIDDTTLSYKFKGGDLTALKALFQNHPAQKIEADLIQKQPNIYVLVLSSTVEGFHGRIQFVEDNNQFLQSLSLFEPNPAFDPPPKFSYPLPEKNPATSNLILKDNTIHMPPQTRYSPTLTEPLTLNQHAALRFTFHITSPDAKTNLDILKMTDQERQKQLQQKIFPITETMQLDELRLDSSLMRPYQKPPPTTNNVPDPPENPSDVNPSNITTRIARLHYRHPQGNLIQKDFHIRDLQNNELLINRFFNFTSPDANSNNPIQIESIEWINESSDRTYLFNGLTYEDNNSQKQTNQFTPANEIIPPENARLHYKGLELERTNNAIDDLIDGVTLNLTAPTTKPINFSIRLNHTEIDDALLNFIGQYNLCIEMLNIALMRAPPNEDVDEKQKYRYGLFQGEHSFRFLRQKISRALSESYVTSQGNELSLMIQIGASSVFFLGDANNINAGKIDFDEEKYHSLLKTMPLHIGEIFGYDRDGDNVVDTGFAYQIDRIQQGYTKGNAVLLVQETINRDRIKTLDQKIAQKEKQIENYRLKLQKDFRELEAAIREQENMEKWLEGMNPKN